jgi:hypothetical protein
LKDEESVRRGNTGDQKSLLTMQKKPKNSLKKLHLESINLFENWELRNFELLGFLLKISITY